MDALFFSSKSSVSGLIPSLSLTDEARRDPYPVAEPTSTSTPQMIYKVKRASNDSEKTMKETKAR